MREAIYTRARLDADADLRLELPPFLRRAAAKYAAYISTAGRLDFATRRDFKAFLRLAHATRIIPGRPLRRPFKSI